MFRAIFIAAAVFALVVPALAFKHGSAPAVGGSHPTYYILGF